MNSVPKLREPPTKSMRVLIKEAAEADQIPNDMGLTPGGCHSAHPLIDCI